MTPPSIPLTRKPFEEQVVSQCAGCGCGCGYVLYKAQGKPVDLYGHPADPKGMGSLCSKGITLVQEVAQNPLRLPWLLPVARAGTFKHLPRTSQGANKRTPEGKVAIVLDRHLSSLEEYLLARQLGDVFRGCTRAGLQSLGGLLQPVAELHVNNWLGGRACLLRGYVYEIFGGCRWKDLPTLSALALRYATLCAKAKRQVLLNPIKAAFFYE
jgi:NADH-dependent fumarate reductase subunit C